jgi:hypothetical protein
MTISAGVVRDTKNVAEYIGGYTRRHRRCARRHPKCRHGPQVADHRERQRRSPLRPAGVRQNDTVRSFTSPGTEPTVNATSAATQPSVASIANPVLMQPVGLDPPGVPYNVRPGLTPHWCESTTPLSSGPERGPLLSTDPTPAGGATRPTPDGADHPAPRLQRRSCGPLALPGPAASSRPFLRFCPRIWRRLFPARERLR